VGPVLTVKKYPNRRLYDTDASRYITMEELAERIRGGRDVRVLDAKTDDDLTQPTLVQLVTEGDRAQKLPVPLLMQLVRMSDDALAEFYTRYMSWALEMYFAMKQRAGTSLNPFAQMPFDMGGALARMFMGPQQQEGKAAAPSAPVANGDEIGELRREIDELKRSLKPRKR
jgi:polyhydroxyalkanoate synthesis repressor PhaR